MALAPKTPQKQALDAFMASPVKKTPALKADKQEALSWHFNNIIGVYEQAPNDEKPSIIAELVAFTRTAVAKLEPNLVEGTTTSIATSKGLSKALDISEDDDQGDLQRAVTGTDDRPPIMNENELLTLTQTAVARLGSDVIEDTTLLKSTTTSIANASDNNSWISKDDEGGGEQHSTTSILDQGVLPLPRLDTPARPLSKELTIIRLQEVMSEFRDRLVERGEFPIVHGKRQATSAWPVDRATELVNHVFTDMLGGLKGRLTSIVQTYNDVDKLTGTSQATAMIATKAASAPKTPPLFVTFYSTLAKKIELDTSNASWNAMVRQANEYRLFEAYESLKHRAATQDKEIVAFLKSQGLQSKQGVTWKSLLVTYLVDQLHVSSRSNLNNLCVAGKAIHSLVDVFGLGALAFLHTTSTYKFRNWGHGSLSQAWPILLELCPELEQLATLIYARIVQPIEHGEALLLEPGLRKNQPVQELVEMVSRGTKGKRTTSKGDGWGDGLDNDYRDLEANSEGDEAMDQDVVSSEGIDIDGKE